VVEEKKVDSPGHFEQGAHPVETKPQETTKPVSAPISTPVSAPAQEKPVEVPVPSAPVELTEAQKKEKAKEEQL